MIQGLIQTNSGWKFESEESLEDFIEKHLEQLLGLKVVARQYSVNDQRCDIIAVDSQKNLFIIELKNTEDRYIIQQLTRYYHGLLETKPLTELVDYNQPVKLLAIKPKFHKDNFIDRLYHTLSFQFYQFSLNVIKNHLYFALQNVDNQELSRIKIAQLEVDKLNSNSVDIPPPSPNLLKAIKEFEPQHKQEILRIREKILSFDKNIQEIVKAGSIKYGNGDLKSSKYCAEFCYNQGNFFLFLWIPSKCLTGKVISRARLWTDWEGMALIEGYVTTGIGTELNAKKRYTVTIMNYLEKEGPVYYYNNAKNRKILKKLREIYDRIYNSQPITYEDIKLIELNEKINNQSNTFHKNDIEYPLDKLIDIALKKWLDRI